MNTHFRNCKSITPINKGAHKICKDNTLITAYNNTIYYVNTITGKIENKITYNKEVTYFTEFKDDLIVGLEDGTLLYGDLSYKLHKTVISCISIIDDFIVTTSYDKTMKIQNNLFETLSTVYCRNMPLKIVNCKDHIATYDVESNIYLYEKNSGKRYRFRVLDDKIVNVLFDSNILYVFYSDSICRVYFSKEMNKLQAKLYLDNKNSEINAGSLDYDTNNHEYNITDSIIANNSIYAVGDCPDIITFNLSCQKISVNNVKISGNGTKGIEYKRIEYNNNFVLTSTEDEIIYLDNNFEIDYVILGNNDEITDFCVYHDTLFIATNSGRLRYMEYRDDEGQYACKGHILEAHEEAIMCFKFCDNYFATASRDKKLKLWKISENDDLVKKVKYSNNLKIEMLHEIETHLESVNSCDIAPGLLVSVGKDNSLQIFKYDENIEQIFNKVVHNKEINYVKICQERRLIVTASQDKSIKAFDFAGTEVGTMNGHRKGVWGLDVGKDILVSCSSDETVRVWSLNDFSCIKILEGFNCTILKVKLYKEDTKVIAAGVNGLVKIWDIKKNRIIGTYNIHTDKVWALLYHENSIVTGSADGAICMLKDETEEKTLEMKKIENVEKEMKFEIIKSIQNKDFLNALKISYNFTDIDEIYRLVVECVNSKVSIESIFEIFENDHSKIMKAISKYIKYFRFAAVNHLLIKECLKRKLFEKKDEALIKVIQKSYNALNDLYIDLVGYEIIFRDFLEETK